MLTVTLNPCVRPPSVFRRDISPRRLPDLRPLKHGVECKAVTVCVAGICLDRGQQRLIFCSDRRIEDGQSGGDVCIKLDHAGDGWLAMIAGNVARARDLAGVCRKALMDKTDAMDSVDMVKLLTDCAHLQKRVLVDNYVRSQLAVGYDYFLEHGRNQFSQADFDQIITTIRSIDLGCEMILAGFIGKAGFLFTIMPDCSVHRQESFAVIGSGGSVAQAALFQRKYQRTLDIQEAIYYAYEAKRLSEVAPGVGPETTVAVAKKGTLPGYSKFEMVNVFYMSRLESQYRKLALQDYISCQMESIFPVLPFRESQSDQQSTKPASLDQQPSQE
jgi:hypothetical protein